MISNGPEFYSVPRLMDFTLFDWNTWILVSVIELLNKEFKSNIYFS